MSCTRDGQAQDGEGKTCETMDPSLLHSIRTAGQTFHNFVSTNGPLIYFKRKHQRDSLQFILLAPFT